MSSPTPDPVRQLFALPRFPAGDARARLRSLIAPRLGSSWWRRIDAIKIAGSNGKGSTAAMVAAILDAAGVRCGLFTSPHLRTPRERTVIDGVPVSGDLFATAAEKILGCATAYRRTHGDEVGAFEALTALALDLFADAEVDTVVLEAGIGGRLDPTGVVPGSCTALVSVDLEHTALLGTTHEAIACDKADLADDGSRLFLGALGDDLVEAVVRHVSPRGVEVVPRPPEGDPRRPETLGLAGGHQRSNARLAAAIAGAWLAEHRPELAPATVDAAVREGLRTARLPGRFERIRDRPAIYVDVAHTPAAMRALAATVRERLGDARILLLAGVAAGRDPADLLAPLAPLAERAITTAAHHRGGDAEAVAGALRDLRADLGTVVVPALHRAIERATAIAARDGLVILVAGGFFLAAEAVAVMEGRDPRALGLL